MKNFPPSVRQWMLSFLIVDAAFWLFLFGGCLVNGVECLESFTFGPYLFYLPVWLLLDAVFPGVPALSGLPFPAVVALLGILGIIWHALVGAAIGWLLRKRTVRWLVSVSVSFVLLLAMFLLVRGLIF